MIEKKIIADLKKLTYSLIENSPNQYEIKKSLDKINTRVQNITEISEFDFNNQQNIVAI